MSGIRGPTAAGPPSLTVVVISLVGGEALHRCLRSLQPMGARRIVVGPPAHVSGLADLGEMPEVQATAEPVPLRRRRGLNMAKTDWVALIEDTCEVCPSWISAIAEIGALGEGAAWSGTVRLSLELRPRYMALACLEYGEFTDGTWQRLSLSHGDKAWRFMVRIPGLNLLYRRSAIADRVDETGVVESDLHEKLRASGLELAFHPDLSVNYFAADRRNATLSARFAHGRIYGGGMAERLLWPMRAARAAACPALPFLFLLRARRALPPGYTRRIEALGWAFLLACAWSLGELTGLLGGRGSSLQAWA